jgi:O-antigen/teichoic acid export membrane protein
VYVAASAIAQFVGLIRSVFLPLILIPAQLGVWNLMGVILSYGSNAHLGILHSMNKTLPILRSQGNGAQVEVTKDTVFWLNLMLGGGAAAALCICAGWVMAENVYALYITSFTIFLLTIFSYYFSLLRAENRFILVSVGVGAIGVLSTVFIVIFALSAGDPLIGALIGVSLAYLLVIFYWSRKGGYHFSVRLDVQTAKELFLSGIPLISICVLDVILLSIDRWILAASLGHAMLGYYALGIMASNMIAVIPGAIASVLYPKMLERYGSCGNPTLLSDLFTMPSRIVAALMSILIGFSVLLLPFLIAHFLPKYEPSITSLIILLTAAFFYSISFISGNYLISIDRQRHLIQVQIVAITCALVFDMYVVHMGWGIVGIAYSTAIVYFIYGCSYMLLAARYAFTDWKASVSFFFQVFGIFSMMLIGLALAFLIIPDGATLATAAIYTLARLILFCLVLLPLLWWINRRGELVNIIRLAIRSKMAVG